MAQPNCTINKHIQSVHRKQLAYPKKHSEFAILISPRTEHTFSTQMPVDTEWIVTPRTEHILD